MRQQSFRLAERQCVGVWRVESKQNDDSGHRMDRAADDPDEYMEEDYSAVESGTELETGRAIQSAHAQGRSCASKQAVFGACLEGVLLTSVAMCAGGALPGCRLCPCRWDLP